MGQQHRTYTDDFKAAAVDRLYEPGALIEPAAFTVHLKDVHVDRHNASSPHMTGSITSSALTATASRQHHTVMQGQMPRMHALTDALHGARAGGDTGRHFPPGDPQSKGAGSLPPFNLSTPPRACVFWQSPRETAGWCAGLP